MTIMTSLLLGLSGAVMISSFAIPTETDLGLVDQKTHEYFARMRSDLREAQKIKYTSGVGGVELKVTMNNQSETVGWPDEVIYRYDSSADQLGRTIKGESEVVFLDSVSAFAISLTEAGGRVRKLYAVARVDDSIQQLFELHAALPYRPGLE